MQECCIFLNAFPSPSTLTPPGPNFGCRRGGFHIRPWDFTPPPTNDRKSAPKNRNCKLFRRRVLAPGRGQSVRSWILKGALAKRSCAARTQAPLSRASRAIGSSGHLFRFLFGCPKRKDWRGNDAIKGCPRRVGTSAERTTRKIYLPIKLPAANATSASFTPSGSFTFTVSGYSAASSRKAWQAGVQAAKSAGVLPPK